MPFNRVNVHDLLNDDTSPHRHTHVPSPMPVSPATMLVCPQSDCGRKFTTSDSLMSHQRRAHGTTRGSYVCPHCRSNFSTSPNLNKHVRSVHEKLKPFKCERCSSCFAFRDGLVRHTRMVHDQVRPFSCIHCPMKFKTKAHLGKHSMSIHSVPLGASTGQRAVGDKPI